MRHISGTDWSISDMNRFKVVEQIGDFWGILDNTDKIVEYYTSEQLRKIVYYDKITIEGCNLLCEDNENKLVICLDENILLDTPEYRLIYDNTGDSYFILSRAYKGEKYRIMIGFWINKRGIIKVKRFTKGADTIDKSPYVVDKNTFVRACRSAKSVNASLFFNFGVGMLEFYSHFLKVCQLDYIFISKPKEV